MFGFGKDKKSDRLTRKQRHSIEKEKLMLTENLKTLDVDDPKYKTTLEAIKVLDELSESHKNGKANRWGIAGKLAIGAALGVVAYKSDIGEYINRNKLTQAWHRIFMSQH